MFWILAALITGIACAALYVSLRRRGVNAANHPDAATEAHFRLQLGEIAADRAAGRLSDTEGEAARREVARQFMKRPPAAGTTTGAGTRWLPVASLAAIAVLSFAAYAALGRPDLPSQPLASRPEAILAGLTLEEAVERIEARLAETPDDARGWRILAPAYVELERFDDAESAYRRLIELAPPDADVMTGLAETLLVRAGGGIEGEPLELLKAAAAADPTHVRSRFYLAAEATRTGAFEDAGKRWRELIALAGGGEPWLATAREGLAAAEAGLAAPGASSRADTPAIRAMVEGLATRLEAEGGSVEEWTRLVRSWLVLDEREAAQAAYDAAVLSYPDAADRVELDALAKSSGLSTGGGAS